MKSPLKQYLETVAIGILIALAVSEVAFAVFGAASLLRVWVNGL